MKKRFRYWIEIVNVVSRNTTQMSFNLATEDPQAALVQIINSEPYLSAVQGGRLDEPKRLSRFEGPIDFSWCEL